MTFSPPPPDVPALLAALEASDPGRPRVTWYGPDGERVELSARVLDNWVAKTANMLVEELDAGTGTAVRLELPMHWRAAVWGLATWAVGAHLVDTGEPDVLVTTSPASGGPCVRRVLVALPAMARAVPGLPPGALDYNREVSGFGDVFVPEAASTPLDLRHHWPSGVRLLVRESSWSMETLLTALAADGSVVLLGTNEVDAHRLWDSERITHRAGARLSEKP